MRKIRRKKWNKYEIFILKQYYGIIPVKEIAKMLDRSIASVDHKASRLGLKSGIRGRYPKFIKINKKS